MDWKTSNHMDGSEIRAGVGLQFFAEGEDTGGTGADMDGFDGGDFLAALEGDDGLGDQQTGTEGAEETVQDGAGDQRAEEQQDEPEATPPEDGEVLPDEDGQQMQTVPLVYNGQQILLPADAVEALTGALGANPVELLQKGMNYDRKGEREFRLLDRYAEASGLTRQQYLAQLEQAQRQQELAGEIEKCRAEFPESPDAALTAIAEGRLASRRAAEMQQAQQRQAEMAAMQERIRQTTEQAHQEAETRAWDEYVAVSGVKSVGEVPQRVIELVQQEGMTPVAAHWRYQAEQNAQAVKIEKKNNTNRQTSPGSVQGNEGDTSDPFLKGFLGL